MSTHGKTEIRLPTVASFGHVVNKGSRFYMATILFILTVYYTMCLHRVSDLYKEMSKKQILFLKANDTTVAFSCSSQ